MPHQLIKIILLELKKTSYVSIPEGRFLRAIDETGLGSLERYADIGRELPVAAREVLLGLLVAVP